jgi:hypothetical protein
MRRLVPFLDKCKQSFFDSIEVCEVLRGEAFALEDREPMLDLVQSF